MDKIEDFKVSYDNSNEEIEKAFIRFQRKYMLRRKIIYSVVFLIAAALALDLMIKNSESMFGYIAFVLSLAMLCVTWMRSYFVRKRLLKTLESLGGETYEATFCGDRIEIDTLLLEEEKTETVAVSAVGVMTVGEEFDVPPEQETKQEKTVLDFTGNTIDSDETDSLFLLFVNRSLIYCIPKRCLSGEEIETLRQYLDDKNI